MNGSMYSCKQYTECKRHSYKEIFCLNKERSINIFMRNRVAKVVEFQDKLLVPSFLDINSMQQAQERTHLSNTHECTPKIKVEHDHHIFKSCF